MKSAEWLAGWEAGRVAAQEATIEYREIRRGYAEHDADPHSKILYNAQAAAATDIWHEIASLTPEDHNED